MGGHNTDRVTLVWPQGSLGKDNSTRPQHIQASSQLSHDASGPKEVSRFLCPQRSVCFVGFSKSQDQETTGP